MAEPKMNTPKGVVERNIALVGQIMEYLLDHPEVFEALPDEFELVILPEDDPEMRLYNLELLDKFSVEEKPVVFARTRFKTKKGRTIARPSLFVPIVPVAL
jgi:hypothetical protein